MRARLKQSRLLGVRDARMGLAGSILNHPLAQPLCGVRFPKNRTGVRCAGRWSALMQRSSLILLGFIAGCATTSSIPDPEDLYYMANAAFAGRSIDDMVSRYGFPDQRTTWRGQDAVTWNVATTMQWRGGDQVTKVQGRIGDASRWPFTDLPYSATVTVPTSVSESYRCTMMATVGKNGRVIEVQFAGKMGACQVFVPSR